MKPECKLPMEIANRAHCILLNYNKIHSKNSAIIKEARCTNCNSGSATVFLYKKLTNKTASLFQFTDLESGHCSSIASEFR